MKTFWIITAVLVFFKDALCQETGRNLYSRRYDNLDIDTILASPRLVTNYVECLLNRKPCPPEGKDLKRILPEALRTKCGRCTLRQKENALKVITILYKDYPHYYKALAEKWDTNGEYNRRFEEYLRNEQFNAIPGSNVDEPVSSIGNRNTRNNSVDFENDQSQINVQAVPVSTVNRIPLDFRPSQEPKPYSPIPLPTNPPTTTSTTTTTTTQQTQVYTTRRTTRNQQPKKTSRRVSSMNTTPRITVDTTTPAPPLITTPPSTTPFSSTEQFLPISNRFGEDFDYDSKTEEIQTTTNIANIDEISSNEMEVATTNYENFNEFNEKSSQSSSTEIHIENGIDSSSNIIISSTTTYIFVNPSPSMNPNSNVNPSSSNPSNFDTKVIIKNESQILHFNPHEVKKNEGPNTNPNHSPNQNPNHSPNPQNFDTKIVIRNENPMQNFNPNEMQLTIKNDGQIPIPNAQNFDTKVNINSPIPSPNPQNFDNKMIIKNESPSQNFNPHITKLIIRNEAPIPQNYDTKFVIKNQNYQNFNPNVPTEAQNHFSHAQIKNSYDLGPPPPIQSPPFTNNAQNIHTIITNSNSENPVAPQTIYVIQNPQHPHRILFNKKAKPSVKNKFTNIALKICKNGQPINDIRIQHNTEIIDNFFIPPAQHPFASIFNSIGNKITNTAETIAGMVRTTVNIIVGGGGRQKK